MKINYNDEVDQKIEESKKSFEPMPLDREYWLSANSIDELKDSSGLRGYTIEYIVKEPQEFYNRKIWKKIYLVPSDGSQSKRDTLLGMFVGFLDQLGIDKQQRIELFSVELTVERLKEKLFYIDIKVLLKNNPYTAKNTGELKVSQEIAKVLEYKVNAPASAQAF